VEALDWILTKGKDILSLDTSKLAVGGSSSGGNLAAIVALKNAERSNPNPLSLQLLIVPATDHHAESKGLWKDNIHAPWLTPDRMRWFVQGYLPNEADKKNWDASPFYAPDELVEKMKVSMQGRNGKALFLMTELDILLGEGKEYAQKLRAKGIPVEEVVYKGAPHPIMAMDG
jgi:acetyl esterase/lipase